MCNILDVEESASTSGWETLQNYCQGNGVVFVLSKLQFALKI